MPVPFIDLKRFEPDFLDRWMAKCRDLTVNTRFVLGPEVAELEKRLIEESGAKAVVACANGTDAIQLALRAAGVGIGDKVLIPDMTFWATFEAVCNVGAKPITVDLDMADLQMDFDLFRKAAEEVRPKAAILVHLYGWGTARLNDYRQYCAEKGILLIEDGAQCFGTKYNGESLMKDAWLGTVSFYPAKVLGASGDAGAVYCSSAELAEKVRQLGNHGRTTHYEHGLVGWNSRVGVFESSFLLLCMDYIDARLESRRKVAAQYRERFAEAGIRTVGPPEGYLENGYLAVTLHDPAERPALAEALKAKGIGFGTVYPGAMSLQSGANGWIAGKYGGERADYVARGILNPPLFAYMRDEEVEEVMAVMVEVAK
jgi:UDP-2-acetamido-2-deoxy-ribo-hexuluronate aminotransferase